MKQIKPCKCGSTYIVNKKYNLCQACNNERLHGSKYGKRCELSQSNRKPLKSKKKGLKKGLSAKAIAVIKKDEETYEKVFNLSENHKCEECGTQLNIEFRDNEGKVNCRWRYAHRWAKSSYPEWRHEVKNIMNLCLICHQRYDFADVKNMKVYQSSLAIKEGLRNEKN